MLNTALAGMEGRLALIAGFVGAVCWPILIFCLDRRREITEHEDELRVERDDQIYATVLYSKEVIKKYGLVPLTAGPIATLRLQQWMVAHRVCFYRTGEAFYVHPAIAEIVSDWQAKRYGLGKLSIQGLIDLLGSFEGSRE